MVVVTHARTAPPRDGDRVDVPRPLKVLVVDDHPAVLAGVAALVDAAEGPRTIGTIGDPFAVAPAVRAQRPDVVVLDRQLPGLDGLTLCRTLRRAPAPPAVHVYSAFVTPDLLVPAHIAGACALTDKGTEPSELTLAIRRAGRGERLLERAGHELLDAAGKRLPGSELPLLGMLMNDVPLDEIAEVLGVSASVADRRVDRLLSRLLAERRPW